MGRTLEIHYGVIGGMIRALNPQINPRYCAAVDQRVYMDTVMVGIPDDTVIEQASSTK